MPPKKKETVNWTYNNKEVTEPPEGYEGFVYIIHNLTNKKFYIGRKSFYSYSKKKLTAKEKLLPENKRKTFKITKTNTSWQKYTGSCKELNEHIKNGDVIKKEIIRFCRLRKHLTAWELKEIICSDCLQREDCYNNNVLGKIFSADFEN